MNSYFFFGFNIFKDKNATFMCQVFPRSSFDELENLKTENERLVNSLKKSGEIKESKRK